MPTTVTSTSGVSYHLWQLPNESAPEPSDSHEFSMLENEMSEGYRSTELFGLNTGIRSWTLPMPTLADSSVIAAAVTDPYAATVSRVDYVRNLYKYNRTTGTPFAYQDPNSGQYYLVDMVNPELSMTKIAKGVDIYSSTITLRQRRLNGVTVFDVNAIDQDAGTSFAAAWYKGASYTDGAETWAAAGSYGSAWAGNGDVNNAAAIVNGFAVARFNNSASTGYTTLDWGGNNVYDVFLVMQMREATFSNAAGILTGSGPTDTRILLASSGTTKFANPALTASLYTYRKNGTEYAQSDLQAPMNAWGVVHVRYETGFSYGFGSFLQLGRDRTTAGTYAKMDVAEIVITTGTPLSTLKARELTEYLAVKYEITLD